MSINTTTKTRKGRRRIFSAVVAVVAAVALGIGLFSSLGTTTVYAADADASTVASWQDYANNTTANIGRIWTDKSVSTSDVSLTNTAGNETIRVPKTADADFLVGLSALSTASSLQTTTSQPLDIVLVLDVSGSMDDELYSYTAVYSQDLNTNRSYYIQDGNDWREVEYSRQRREWGYSTGIIWQEWHEAIPKTSADDNASDHVQFYARSSTSKIDALKSAVNGFIDSTAESNVSLANDKKHRISIVKFADDSYNYTIGNNKNNQGYNYTQVVSDFSYDSDALKRNINSLDAAGATSADYGMTLAEKVLAGGRLGDSYNSATVDGAREAAKKVVVFFTDGEPNHSNGFSGTVANATITAAKEMKDDGVTIYTVGVFEDADPTNTSERFNGYMHGVSSNYPAATAYNNLGTRAEDSDYYKAASDSDELASIFQDIFDESSASSGAPTQVEEGFDAHNSGYITFTDQLGSYMEVDDVNGVVFAGTLYEKITTETDSDGTVHYIFNQVVDNNEIYPNGTLADLIITVAKSENLADPDTVTVKIPASLIPVRYYDMEMEDGVTTEASITDAYPIRVFYSVSIKDGVTTALQEGATNADYDGLLTYMEENKDAAGTAAYFYSNDFTKDAERGNTTVDFTPASGNSFYFFTEDTPLYIDENGTNRATGELSADVDYYYPKTVYTIENGTATSVVQYVKVPGANVVEALNMGQFGVKQDEDGYWYVATGTQKITRTEVERPKENNITETASKVIEPEWNGSNIRVYLGNNGRLAVDIPGSLSVSKTVAADEGFTLPSGYENQEFEFALALANLPQGAAAEYTAEIKNADGTASGDAFLIGNNDKFTLKHGQTLYVYGLPDGATYTVTETPVTGYDSAQTHTPAGENLTEQMIYAGLTASTTVTNTYTADPVTVIGSDVFGVTKVFGGRDTTADDVFDFVLYASTRNPDSNAVPADTSLAITMPNETTPVTSDMEAFGDITFTKPGTYTYYVYEDDSDAIPGVDYDQTYYIVTIEVTPVNGVLQATASYQIAEPEQEATEYTYNEDTGLVFENSYDADSTTVYLSGQKSLQGRDLNRGEFTFQLTAVSKDGTRYEAADAVPSDFPLPTTSAGVQTVGATTTNGQYAASGSPVNNIYFGSLTFDAAHIGHTYTYEIKEVVPADADMLGGVTYDTTIKTVTIEVTEDTTSGDPVVKATVKGTDGAELNTYPYYTFANEYKPASVTITGDTAITVQKTLTGRDWLDNETYEFTIANTQSPDGVTAPMPADESIEIGKPAQGAVNAGAFGDMTFDQAGTYVYSITETSADKAGVTMDKHTATVTVEVTDNLNGQLVAAVTYDNSAALTDADKAETALAAFTNVYSATGSTVADDLSVTKNLTGRTWLPTDRFEFTLQIDEEHDATVAALDEGSIVLPQNTELVIDAYTGRTLSFGNITFTKPGEYHFIIKETVPTEGAIPGITYDAIERKVIITVTDVDHNGQLTVTKSDQSDDLTFENVYEAQPTDLNGNTYLKVIKNFTGRPDDEWMEGDAFTFTLAGGNDATLAAIEAGDIVMPADLETTIDNTDDLKEKAFGNITFKKAGNYVFTVTEQASGIAGVTDDSKPVRTLNVSVVDNLNGTMTATVTAESDNLIFNNNYEPASGTLSGDTDLKVSKNFTGRNNNEWLEGDSFTFTLTPDADTQEKIEAGAIELGATEVTIDHSSDPKTAAFGDIAINEVGTYVFTIQEAAGDLENVEYSEAVYTVTVTATDAGDGTLNITSVMTEADDATVADHTAVFTNTYTPDSVTVTGETELTGTKTLTGRDSAEGETYEFTLAPTGDTIQAVADQKVVIAENGDSASVTDLTDGTAKGFHFGNITFTERGTYTFTVEETLPEGVTKDEPKKDGVTYDTHVETITIVVTDDYENAGLQAEVQTDADGVAFTNVYTTADSSLDAAELAVEKIFTGREGDEWTDNDEFTFTITGVEKGTQNAAPLPAATEITLGADDVKDGVYVKDFGPITYGMNDRGKTYVYTITETSGNVYAVTYSKAQYEVEVTVTDNGGGTLTVEAARTQVADDSGTATGTEVGADDNLVFTNTYKVPTDEKTVTTPDDPTTNIDGQLVGVGDILTYNIHWVNTAVDDQGVAVGATVTVTDTIPAGTKLVADSISEGGAESGGTITWTIDADAAAEGDVSFQVEITDDAVTQDDINNEATINIGDDERTTNVTHNDIPKKTTGDIDVDGTVQVGDEITYAIEYANTTGETADIVITDTLTKGLTFVNASNDGSYDKETGTVTWTLKDIANGESGSVTLTVQVNEDAVTVDAINNTATINVGEDHEYTTNTVPGEVKTGNLTISKTIVLTPNQGTEIDTNKEFTFTINLTDASDNKLTGDYVIEGTDPAQTVTDGSTITLKHGESVTITGLPEGAKYTVTEAEEDGYTATDSELAGTVTTDGATAAFENTYNVGEDTLTGADNLEVTKNFTGRADDAWLESDEFTFTLAANNDATKAAVESGTVVLPDNADGITIAGTADEKTAAFGDITFKAAGTYEFVITELDTEKIPGVTYDTDLDRIITVQVTDNKNGELVASVAAGSDNLTFNNTYATGDGTLDGATALNIEKTLTGRDAWTDHDVFTFTLTGSEGAPMPDETIVVLTKDNVADGMTAAGSFGDITYKMDDRGKTYTYTITEQAGTVYGMTYSKAEYTVTVKVEDNGQGGLDVTSTMTQTKAADGSEIAEPAEADAAAFENSYKIPDNTKTVEKIDGDVKTDVNGQLVGVGDELTYTIHWVNDAIDETNGDPADATVVITDQVPAGTEFVSAENDGVYADGTVTWTIDAAAAEEGDVSFTVKVTEDAVTVDQVTNTASVQVGTNDPKYTNEVTVDVPEKSVEDNTPDTGVQVGDELTYTIEYANTTDEAVDIVIRDTLHEGLTFKSADNDGTHENGVVTWTLKDVQPGTKGTVSVTAIVNEKALGEEIDNKATIQVGDDPEIDTSTVTTETKTGDLKISKMVTVDETQGTTIDTNKEFTFDVTLKNAAGENLTETYSFTGTTDGETAYDGEIANGNGRITLKHNGSITIEGLPEGATYTVTEAEAGSGYTQVTPAENAAATGTIEAGKAVEAAFVNAYDAAEATGVPAGFTLTKVLEGKSWDDDAFSFVLTGVDGAPMPEADEANGIVVNEDGTVTKTVSAATGKDGDNDIAAFDFGEIKYSKAGTYTYTVTEVKGDNPGIAYDDHTATITVVVTDIQDGSATGQLVATATVTNGTFTNNYDTGSVDYDARGGIKVTKNMADRRITADEFEFVMTAKDEASAEKLGAESKSVKTAAADLKQTEDGSYVATTTMDLVTGMTFTKADVDKTYTYEVKETNGGSTIDGVTFDSKVYEVKIEVLDTDKQGVLTVNTYVDGELKATWTAARTRAAGDPVELVFNNSYDAGTISVGGEGDVKINATKTLVNDELQDGQFTFKVTDIKGNEVASGKNDAAGTIDFSEIKYTTESLNRDAETGVATRDTAGETDVYTYQYTVSEVTDNLADQGITATNASFSIKVKVTDDRKGSLTAEVIYPDGSDNGLAFQNVYGQGETVDLVLKGQKVLESAEGLKVPDITGKYTFTLEGLEGAPMPESNTATNDQAGNVTFGTITYKMEEVFGNAATTTADDVEAAADDSGIETYTAGRTKTYTYTVTESGTVAGVTNENAVKTIEVTVTDLGGGKLSAGVTSVSEGTPDGMNFKFTNTYSVDPTDSNPTVDTDLTFQKILDVQSGTKELQADEFTFELYSMAEDAGTAPVMTGTNGADGKIQMSPAITFTKPGVYDYRLVEVIPEDAVLVDGYYELNGITYLGYEYNLTATVTDNSDGTMTVTWKMYNSDGEDIEEVQTAEFVNMYSVSETDVTFSAGKTLTGRDLKAGEFTFEVKDEDGNVVDTATNDENGIVQFGTMTFSNVCERTFYVSEVKGDDKTITYDDTVYTVSVKVTDDGLGHLIAETAYDGDNMVFKNTYTKPAEPEKPDDTGAVKTGDSSTILPVIIALAAALIAIAAVVVIMIRRRRR